jgi:hypothetical protein
MAGKDGKISRLPKRSVAQALPLPAFVRRSDGAVPYWAGDSIGAQFVRPERRQSSNRRDV